MPVLTQWVICQLSYLLTSLCSVHILHEYLNVLFTADYRLYSLSGFYRNNTRHSTHYVYDMYYLLYSKRFFLKQYSHWFPFLYTACFKFAINSTNIMQPFFSNSWEEGYYSGAPTPQARHQGKQIYMNKISIGWTISHSTAVINYSLLC